MATAMRRVREFFDIEFFRILAERDESRGSIACRRRYAIFCALRRCFRASSRR